MQLADLKFKDGSKFTSLLDLVFPIGSTYMSMGSASPDTLFGGTWSKVTGGVLALAGTSGYAAAGAAGGSKKISVSQMPSHAHLYIDTGKFCWNVSGVANAPAWGEAGGDTGVLTGKAGGGRTIIRSTSRSIYGGVLRNLSGGAQWLTSSSRTVPAIRYIARSLSEECTSARRTFLRRPCGPEQRGLASRPGRSSPQAEARRQAITPSARREALRASRSRWRRCRSILTTRRMPLRGFAEAAEHGSRNIPQREELRERTSSVATTSIRVADNLMRTGRRTSPSICGKELNKEAAA